jgi:hypothetical protein
MDGMERDYHRYIEEVTDTWLGPMWLSFRRLDRST